MDSDHFFNGLDVYHLPKNFQYTRLAVNPQQDLKTWVYSVLGIQPHHRYVDVAVLDVLQPLIQFRDTSLRIKKPLVRPFRVRRPKDGLNFPPDLFDLGTSLKTTRKESFNIPCPPPGVTELMTIGPPPPPSLTFTDNTRMVVPLQPKILPYYLLPLGYYLRLYEHQGVPKAQFFGTAPKVPIALLDLLIEISTGYDLQEPTKFHTCESLKEDDIDLHPLKSSCQFHPPCTAAQVLLQNTKVTMEYTQKCQYFGCDMQDLQDKAIIKHLSICRRRAQQEGHPSFENVTECHWYGGHHIPTVLMVHHLIFCPYNPDMKKATNDDGNICVQHICRGLATATSYDVLKHYINPNTRKYTLYTPKCLKTYLIARYKIKAEDIVAMKGNIYPSKNFPKSQFWVRTALIQLLDKFDADALED